MGFTAFLIILLLVLGCCLAFVGMQGMWGAALSFMNTLLAALLATSYWEPMAGVLQGMNASYTYFFDILAIWLMFGLFLIPLRVATDFISKVKVRFLPIADQIGGYFFGFLTGWVLICFLMFSLHTAPLPRNFLGFWQPTPESRLVVVAPDRRWLGFVNMVSRGALYNGNEFDPRADYIIKYGQRRADLEKQPALRVPSN